MYYKENKLIRFDVRNDNICEAYVMFLMFISFSVIISNLSKDISKSVLYCIDFTGGWSSFKFMDFNEADYRLKKFWLLFDNDLTRRFKLIRYNSVNICKCKEQISGHRVAKLKYEIKFNIKVKTIL